MFHFCILRLAADSYALHRRIGNRLQPVTYYPTRKAARAVGIEWLIFQGEQSCSTDE
jgi:hypothetical protein